LAADPDLSSVRSDWPAPSISASSTQASLGRVEWVTGGRGFRPEGAREISPGL